MRTNLEVWCLCCLVASGCARAASAPGASPAHPEAVAPESATFADDLAFLQKHTPVVVLEDAAGLARVIVAPEYQGRVMTSTATGDAGPSFGFIHREVIAKHQRVPHMNVFGGEDRFWLGPEAGQYGLYFPKGAAFDLAHWQVPEPLDWGPWPVQSQTPHEVRLRREMTLTNYSGTTFQLAVDRTVRVLERPAIAAAFGVEVPSPMGVVAHESVNTIENTGSSPWVKESGLLSVWILGMYKHSPHTTIVIPFRAGPEAERGPVVNDAYFGRVPPDRLQIDEGVLFFRGDGAQRGKIGISGTRAKPIVGAYDAQRRVLTLVQYNLDESATDYVNSMWRQQERPYAGDVVNSYNDGPPEPGKKPLGPFYEIETSSRAAALAPGETLTHEHRTLHLVGPRESLDAIARRTLGVGLDRIESAFRASSQGT